MQTLISKLIGLYLNVLSLVAPGKAARAGFELFCYPFRTKITGKQKEFFELATQFVVNTNNGSVQAYRWGVGSKNILLLHGWQSHTYRWKNYVEALDKSEYTIYSIDAPAHGQSPGKFMTVPLYSEAIRALYEKIGNVHTVIAHSLGSFTAIYTFFERPELTPDKLISLSSPGEAKEFFDFYKSKLGLTERTLNLTITRFEEVVKQTPGYFSAPFFASFLKIPGLIIHDEQDTETSVENSKAIHKEWANSTLLITKGIGHNLKSKEVITTINQFINQEQISKPTQPPSLNFHLN